MPRGLGTHAFVVFTRGGIRIGRFFFPGMEGTACYAVALILALKGYNMRGVLGIDMPANWKSLHPGMSVDNAKALGARAKPRIERFAEAIVSGTTVVQNRESCVPYPWSVALAGVNRLPRILSDRSGQNALCQPSLQRLRALRPSMPLRRDSPPRKTRSSAVLDLSVRKLHAVPKLLPSKRH